MYDDERPQLSTGKVILGCVGILLFIIAIPVLLSIKTISPTEVAVVTSFGQTKGVATEGVRLALFEGLTVYTKQVKITSQKFDGGSKDGQYVYLDGTFSYSLKTDKVAELYSNVGDIGALEQKIVTPTLFDVVKQATAKFGANEVLQRQAELRAEIKKLIDERMDTKYLTIVDFAITNIDFTPQYNQAIEAKQVAEQKAQQAKLEADERVTRAQADAEAYKLQLQNLTPELLQKQWIEKWNGILPTTMTGNATGLYLPVK